MKTKKTFLNFYKLILEKVRFSPELFWAAYQKAIRLLDDYERDELNDWIYKNGINRKAIIK